MIVKLEWKQSNAQQNIKQLQNPTMEVTINNESITTEPPPLDRNWKKSADDKNMQNTPVCK